MDAAPDSNRRGPSFVRIGSHASVVAGRRRLGSIGGVIQMPDGTFGAVTAGHVIQMARGADLLAATENTQMPIGEPLLNASGGRMMLGGVADGITRLVDLHRVRVLVTFRLVAPTTFADERAMFSELNSLFHHADTSGLDLRQMREVKPK